MVCQSRQQILIWTAEPLETSCWSLAIWWGEDASKLSTKAFRKSRWIAPRMMMKENYETMEERIATRCCILALLGRNSPGPKSKATKHHKFSCPFFHLTPLSVLFLPNEEKFLVAVAPILCCILLLSVHMARWFSFEIRLLLLGYAAIHNT